MDRTHSPLPWQLKELDLYEGSKGSEVISTDETVLDNQTYYPHAVSNEDAAFIVRACNAHYRFVAALQWIADHSNDSGVVSRALRSLGEAGEKA